MTRFERHAVVEIAQEMGISWPDEEFDLDDLWFGMNVEAERATRGPLGDTAHDSPTLAAQLAFAHLREDPEHYDRLKEIEHAAHPGIRGDAPGPHSPDDPVD